MHGQPHIRLFMNSFRELTCFLLQLFLNSAISEVHSLIEIKEQHKEDDGVDDQHSGYQFWVSAVEYEDLCGVYEHQCELQLWNKVRC